MTFISKDDAAEQGLAFDADDLIAGGTFIDTRRKLLEAGLASAELCSSSDRSFRF
jgi:hypothetical protein